MAGQEISVNELKEILEVSEDLNVKDHTPRNIAERTARLLAEKDEEVAPEVLLKKKVNVDLEELSVQDIRQHIDEKYGAIADPEITNVNVYTASIGYDPDDYSVKADYRMQVNWGYKVRAFSREAGETHVGKMDIRAEEQPTAVVKALKKNVDLESIENYRISRLKQKLPRKKKYHPKKFDPRNLL